MIEETLSVLDPESIKAVATPAGYITLGLGKSLYQWQKDFVGRCIDVTKRHKGALCTPNGAGKSERIVSGLVLWWLMAHARGRVAVTTRDAKQLDNQIEPALMQHSGKMEDWKFISRRIENSTGGFCQLFTTDEPGRAEGWHQGFLENGQPDPEAPLLIIVDEAKSVDERIFQAIDRCTYNVLLYVSSPGVKSGRFYEAFARDTGFFTMKVGLADCPHIPKERIDDIVRSYGADHPFTLSTLHGEFMDEDADSMFIIPPSVVRAVIESPPSLHAAGKRLAFCDFAGGGDECVLALKTGNKIEITSWREPNTMASVGRFITEFSKRNLRPSDIYGDEGGLGGPMIDRLAEAGWPINRVNNGDTALNPDRYENRGAEMWHQAGMQMSRFEIILPNDQKLVAQLTTRKTKFLSDGRIGAESKKDMAKRGLNSPDRADGTVGVMAIESEIAASQFDADGIRHLESNVRQPKVMTLTPADFGVNNREDKDGWAVVWEEPTFGRAYFASLKRGPAGWSVFVLRRQCFDDKGKPMPDAVVARIKTPCTWDANQLAQRIEVLLRWYGNPVIVPDIRGALDILDALKNRGISIHGRPVFDRQQGSSMVFGWETTDKTVAVAVASLAAAVREKKIAIPDPFTVNAIRGYTQTDLDDGEVIGLGIGLHCIESAIVYSPQAQGVRRREDVAMREKLGGACL